MRHRTQNPHSIHSTMNREQLPQLNAPPRGLALILLIPLLLAGICQLFKAAQALSFRGDNTFPESAVVQIAEWSRDTGRIYPPLAASPYTPAPYGPLFYMALSALARLSHLGLDQLMVTARSIVLICFLLLPWIAYRWTRRAGVSSALALAGSAMILAQIDFLDWNVTVRPDLPALVLTVVAFYLLTGTQLTPRILIVAGVLCALAAFFKQSFIALPFVFFLWVIVNRRWRHLLLFVTGGGVTALGILGYLQLHHEPFLQEILLARYSPVSAFAALQLLKADVVHYPWQTVFGVLALFGALWIPKGNSLRGLLLLYLLFAWLAGFYTSMAPGANVNAFLEAWVMSAMLATLGLQRISESWASVPRAAQAALLASWIAVTVVSLEAWRIPMSLQPTVIWTNLADLAQGRRVLSDFPYVSAHGVRPELLDPSVNHYLELAGYWSPQPVLDEVHRQDFDLVLVGLNGGQPRQWRGFTIFSHSILRQISADYRMSCASDRFAVYVPTKRPVLDPRVQERLFNLGCKAGVTAALAH